jgi:hypothetical protein
MNANELADVLENDYWDSRANKIMLEGAKMLRQQQNEIEDLKSANRFIQNFAEEQHQRAVALEMRELTDEEITDVFVECLLPDGEFDEHEFARAILKKAQEK